VRIDTISVQKSAQTALAKEAQSAHFYTQEGAARYSDKVKTGPNKGKECAVNLRHARKENLYPSITHIHKCLSERALTFYRESHLLAAARFLEQGENETDIDYYHRVNIEARKDSLEAARQGTDVHKSMECILKGEEWDTTNPMLVTAAEWVKENIEETLWIEKTLVNHSLKIAGRCDALVRFRKSSSAWDDVGSSPVILDFKTRRFKSNAKGKWIGPHYHKDIRQVSFYASCLKAPARASNLLLNTTPEAPTDLPPTLVIYTEEEQFGALVSVAHLAAIWRHEHNYQPNSVHVSAEEWQRMQPVRERMWD
jgi:hypothetical protein